MKNPFQIGERGGAVAAHEHHLVTSSEILADRNPALVRIHAKQITDKIVAGVGSPDGNGRMHVTTDSGQIPGEQFADIFLKHLESRPAIQTMQHIVAPTGYLMGRADGRTPLGQSGNGADLGSKQDPRNATFGDIIGDLFLGTA